MREKRFHLFLNRLRLLYSIPKSFALLLAFHNGKDGAAAPAIGIAQFEGIYYWTLGGDDQWLLDDNQNKIPVAGQNGKTPTINKDGYWEIDGETIKGEDGQPIKAVGKDGANGDKGEDGDSFFKSVVQDDENVTFTLTNGDQIVLPKAKEVNFVIERTSLTLKFGASQNLAVTQKGVENLAIAKPDGWRAWLEGDVLTITAPAKENVYAETSGEVSVVAVGATATVIAKVQVLATDEILGGAGAGSSEWEEWN
ncbi:PL29 family lyase N-terminal domain-containing protein [Alistipes putredinis]|uniref:PL29 family lyase N-terminal domain-containing protein n=1 Tax=Alistipes putredinis TaxID=28117 RepID=UPI003AF14B73